MIGAILGGAAAIGQGYFQRKAQDRQNKANRELAEYSYSKDLEQWNRTNAYNDPSQQMSRLKKAGINPNSIYGTSSATGNAGSTTAKYNTPTQQYKANIDLPSMVGMYNQVENTKANTNLLNAKATTEYYNTSLKEALARQMGLKNTFDYETLMSRIRGQKADDQSKNWTSQFKKIQTEFAKQGKTVGESAKNQISKDLYNSLRSLIGLDPGESLFRYNR